MREDNDKDNDLEEKTKMFEYEIRTICDKFYFALAFLQAYEYVAKKMFGKLKTGDVDTDNIEEIFYHNVRKVLHDVSGGYLSIQQQNDIDLLMQIDNEKIINYLGSESEIGKALMKQFKQWDAEGK